MQDTVKVELEFSGQLLEKLQELYAKDVTEDNIDFSIEEGSSFNAFIERIVIDALIDSLKEWWYVFWKRWVR